MKQSIQHIISESISVKSSILKNETLLKTIDSIVNVITNSFQAGFKVQFCGNGGSAADAQHLAAEFSGRFYKNRRALPSDALHCNSSYLTAVANDYSYDDIYARLVDGTMVKGDVLVGITTSGNSGNIVKAFEVAYVSQETPANVLSSEIFIEVTSVSESSAKIVKVTSFVLV